MHGLTVGAYLQQWLAGKRSLRDTTRRNYATQIRLYHAPNVGDIRLADLRPHRVDLLYHDLLATPSGKVTAATVRHVHATLRSALNTAVTRRLIPWNPALHVELPSRHRTPGIVWTPEQLGQFLDAIVEHRLYALVHLIAVAGLRRSEAIGLHWDDVDQANGVVHVRLQLVDAGRGPHLGPPNTKSGTRTVPIDRATATVFKAHAAAQQLERTTWGAAWTETGLVFTQEDGCPLRPDYVTRLFWSLTKRAELPPIRLHDLRHTNASLALAAGIPLKVVSHRTGHSSTAITSDLYTHVTPAVGRDAADRIAAFIPRRGQTVDRQMSSADLAQEPVSNAEDDR